MQILLEDARPIVVCTKKSYENLLNSDIVSINLDDKWLHTLAVQNGCDGVESNATQNVSLDDPAFVVFSSGTTGKPKGTKINLRSKSQTYSNNEIIAN